LTRRTTTEQNIINSIIDASETELIRLHQDLWVMREAFKKLVTEFVGSQHDTDVGSDLFSQLKELEDGFIRQIEKHWSKWQAVFKEFEEAARNGLREMNAKHKKEMSVYEEYLEKTMQTDFRPNQQLKDLHVAELIMESKAE
jgi:hypothetical protein